VPAVPGAAVPRDLDRPVARQRHPVPVRVPGRDRLQRHGVRRVRHRDLVVVVRGLLSVHQPACQRHLLGRGLLRDHVRLQVQRGLPAVPNHPGHALRTLRARHTVPGIVLHPVQPRRVRAAPGLDGLPGVPLGGLRARRVHDLHGVRGPQQHLHRLRRARDIANMRILLQTREHAQPDQSIPIPRVVRPMPRGHVRRGPVVHSLHGLRRRHVGGSGRDGVRRVFGLMTTTNEP